MPCPSLHRSILIFSAILLPLLLWHSIRPSHHRNWSPDQALLPYAEINGDRAHIHHIRNAVYRTTTDYDLAYYEKSFDLNSIKSVWYVVEPFSTRKGAAHTFLSFGFDSSDHTTANQTSKEETAESPQEYLAISVEIRKEKGEKFSALKGLFKQYELMYVIGDERDLIKLRANIRKDDVYLYPISAPKEKIRALFVDMLGRANQLREHPEFYNTLTNTCTTNIVSHINTIAPGKIPWSYKVLLPGYSDELAYEMGLIDTDLPFDEARQQFHINDRAREFADDPEFSGRIRASR